MPTTNGHGDDQSGSEVEDNDDEDLSSLEGDIEEANLLDLPDDEQDLEKPLALDDIIESKADKKERKRKRKQEDGLEEEYMRRLAKEEEEEEEERRAERKLKRQKTATQSKDKPNEALDSAESESGEDIQSDEASEDDAEEEGNVAEDDDDDDDGDDNEKSKDQSTVDGIPLHESLAPNRDAIELEKASRTVFLANVSTEAIRSKAGKKTLLTHMGSFLESLPDPPEGKPAHKVESIRFRSTAFAGTALPKKAAFAKKELLDATTRSTNAYVVYSTAYAAREAVKRLNGSVVLDRHLRVDGVAHPSKIDHRRCVFVGNLGFVDDESVLDQDSENKKKRNKVPSDIEEGLWRQFGKAGSVESVRVVRDEKTRVGKGFAYVQFHVSDIYLSF